jgi:hypothetical protein
VRNGTTSLLVNETGGNSLMNVDGADYTSGGRTATAMSGAMTMIGRDTTIEGDTSATSVFAWMAANTSPTRHFWFNRLTHGNHEARLSTVLIPPTPPGPSPTAIGLPLHYFVPIYHSGR